MGQMNKGMQKVEARELLNDVEKKLESLKRHLWNGNITQALRLIDYLHLLLKNDTLSLERKKLLKAVRVWEVHCDQPTVHSGLWRSLS